MKQRLRLRHERVGRRERTYGGIRREFGRRRGIVIMAALVLFCATMGNVFAYTYTYHNQTGYLIRVTVRLYDDDRDKTGQINPTESYTISSRFLLRSWTAEVFLKKRWQQILNMTCDLLPGNHSFSIYVDETKDPSGIVTRTWNALIK